MLKVAPEQRSVPDINLVKVCFIVEKSRELLGEDEGFDPVASNRSDDEERRMMTDAAGDPIRSELVQFIDDLDIDEQNALVALLWIGRGDFEPEHWEAAVALAAERQALSVSTYLLSIPRLPDYLEEALSDYGRSCRDFG